VTEQELIRGAARRLAIIRHAQEVTGNVSLTCRCFGITRQAFYIWLRRYEEQGFEGLRDRSRRPHTSPNATTAHEPERDESGGRREDRLPPAELPLRAP
jgi:transposase-like protein